MRKLLITIVAFALTIAIIAQSPNAFKYQAVIRDNSGNTINKKQVNLRISILKNNINGTAVYTETFSPTTNDFGLVTLEIGRGTVVSGNMNSINWGNDDFYILIELDTQGGTNYIQMGTSQLLSVPYALYAKTSGNGFSGSYNDLKDKPDFSDTSKYLRNETDPIFYFSVAKGITNNDTSKWNAKSNFSGNYVDLKGKPNLSDTSKYLESEKDPLFLTSVANGINSVDTAKWNMKSNFSGNYIDLKGKPNLSDTTKYLKTENDPLFSNSVAIGIKKNDTANWNTKSNFSGNYIDLKGKPNLADTLYYLKSETDPIFDISIAKRIKAADTLNWNAKSNFSGKYADLNGKPNLAIYATKNMSNQNFTNLADPESNQEAATKAYVDNLKEQVLQLQAEIGITDIEGNHYKAVKIGSQVWMAENLKTTKYNDGTAISLVTDNTSWASLTAPAYCWFNNSAATYKATYGALYNWYVVDKTSNGGKNVCPSGYYVPTETELITLINYLGGAGKGVGGKLKETGTTHWLDPNTGATNESGYTALPGGERLYGSFGSIGSNGSWWVNTEYSASDAWFLYIRYDDSEATNPPYSKNTGFSVRCIRDNRVHYNELKVTTSNISVIGTNTAIGGGNAIADGGDEITSRGICWSTSHFPTINNNKTINGTGIGKFSSSLAGLVPNTLYYVCAYAINSKGIAYGNEGYFTTLESGSMTSVNDVDGNSYNTVTIGTQVWMTENLKTTKYNDGTAIPLVTVDSSWASQTAPAYCWFYNDAATYKAGYGALYNWYAVNTTKLCPVEWHVPTETEWSSLTNYLGSNAGGKLKESGVLHWNIPNTDATNETGFSALPNIIRTSDFSAIENLGKDGQWWSSTESSSTNSWGRQMGYFHNSVVRGGNSKYVGLSVRCIKD